MKHFNFLFCLAFLYLFSGNLNAQSLHFDGNDDRVIVNNASQFITSSSAGYSGISLSAWVYPEQAANYQSIAGFRDNDISNSFYLLSLPNGVIEGRFRNSGGTGYTITYAPGLNQNKANHLVLTYDGTTLRLYHDKILVSSIAASGTISDTAAPLRIGHCFASPLFHFKGKIDEVSVWNKAISTSEVEDLFEENPTLTDTNLKLYYQFNHPNVTPNGNNSAYVTLPDSKGQIDGNLFNFALSGNESNWVSGFIPELLEVTNTNSSGTGSLRAAVDYANNTAGSEIISFNIPGNGPHTITSTSNYNFSDSNVIIDGTLQPGYSGNPVIILDGGNTIQDCITINADDIEVYGLNMKNFTNYAIFIGDGDRSIIGASGKGNIINSNDTNILFTGPHQDHKIEYNTIGIDENGVGTSSAENAIFIQINSNNNIINENIIGTANPSASNLIHIAFNSESNSVTNNYIGTDENGTNYGAANASGIYLNSNSNEVNNNTIANNYNGITYAANYNNIRQNNYSCNSNKAIQNNGLVNTPVILTSNQLTISGTATYNSTYSRVEIFKQDDSSCSGTACQGAYVAYTNVAPDGTWSYEPSNLMTLGDVYTAKLILDLGTQNYEISEMTACATIACDGTVLEGDVMSDAFEIGTELSYTHTWNSKCYSNDIGNTSKDVFYQFTTLPCTDSIIISTCEGTIINTVLRLLDETGTLIELNNDICGLQSEIIRTDLSPNTNYFIVMEGGSGQSGDYTLSFRQTTNTENANFDPDALIGNTLGNSFLISSFPFSASENTNCYTDSIGNNSADVFYQFTLEECIDSVIISTCNSDFDTYLRLLDASGAQIDADDDGEDNSCGDNTSLLIATELEAGETYYVVVEGFSNEAGNFTLDIETTSQGIAPGDSLSTAIVIPSFPFMTTDSTNNPCLNNTQNIHTGKDIIYQFTTTLCHESLTINYSGNPEYHILDDSGNLLTGHYTSNATITSLEGNTSYYLVVQGGSPVSDGVFTLDITESGGNGLLTGNTASDPIVVTSSDYTSNLINQAGCFTNETGNTTNDVFFQFTTPSCVDSVMISTCEGTDFNTLIRLLDANQTQIDINYNACGIQSQIVRTDLDPNTTYYAVVEGNSGESGSFTLNYRATILADNISNGPNGALGNTMENPFIVPSLPFSANGNTDDCIYSPAIEGNYIDHFYQFTTNACPSEYTFSTCGLTDFDTYLILRDANGSSIIQNNNACGTSSTITTSGLNPNTTYFIEVEGWETTDVGNYNISISSVATGPNTVVYVNQSATGNNDGTTWTDAYTDLQDALANMADCGNEIWVATGTYYTAAPGAGRSATFDLNKNVTIYGGFAGGETDLASRDIDANVVELSGDIDDDGTWANNSFHTVKVDNATVILDGLTIKDGVADQTTFSRARGGGLFVKEANLKLVDCQLENNYASFGGALFATLSEVEINGSMITGNVANNGAALYHSNETAMYINDTRIIANDALVRCAIEVNNSNYTRIVNSVIAGNTASNANALAIISTNRDVQCDIYNSTIIGGTKNRALVTLQVGFGDKLDMNIYNSIVAHQNLNFNKNFVAFNNNVLNLNTTNSYIQGSSVIGTATNNLYSDTAGDLLLAPDDSYALQACSPAIDAGDASYQITAFDILGNDRLLFGNIDMGAYEDFTGGCGVSREASEEFLEMEIEESEFAISKIYPNPTSDILNIAFEMAKEENVQISITDLTGKVIMSQTINSINGSQTETLDVSRLTAGYYMVNLQNGRNRVSQKFVKM